MRTHATLTSRACRAHYACPTTFMCAAELAELGHVNKKALDQFANFNEQRDRLLDRQGELDAAEASIKELIDHLDLKKDEARSPPRSCRDDRQPTRPHQEACVNCATAHPQAIERTFKGVSKHFAEVFAELVPGGSGKLVMKTFQNMPAAGASTASARIATYSGISIKARFVGGGEAQTMQQLSGGQKTMVALCLIFAIQRCAIGRTPH